MNSGSVVSFVFQSTLPLRGATRSAAVYGSLLSFQSTLPLRGATLNIDNIFIPIGNFNPHSPCGERLGHLGSLRALQMISIHTPLAGSDTSHRLWWTQGNVFQSTLPLRGATILLAFASTRYTFQSTLPLRGATSTCTPTASPCDYFNPHSPCGERLEPRHPLREHRISIHTPLAGSDNALVAPCAALLKFQSTLPLRGATDSDTAHYYLIVISIHTPLAGSDCPSTGRCPTCSISIHTPLAGSDFHGHGVKPRGMSISIHTPLAGSDSQP